MINTQKSQNTQGNNKNETNLKFFGHVRYQAGEMVIKESVEPLLEEYRPTGITSLKFSKLSLGNVAPKVEGINQILVFLSQLLSILFLVSSEDWCHGNSGNRTTCVDFILYM